MAFPTQADLHFYLSKQPRPSWALRLVRRELPHVQPVAPIDVLIAAHSEFRPSTGELAAYNLLGILRSKRRRGENLAHELQILAKNPECMINPEKRAAFARKWAARIEGGRS